MNLKISYLVDVFHAWSLHKNHEGHCVKIFKFEWKWFPTNFLKLILKKVTKLLLLCEFILKQPQNKLIHYLKSLWTWSTSEIKTQNTKYDELKTNKKLNILFTQEAEPKEQKNLKFWTQKRRGTNICGGAQVLKGMRWFLIKKKKKTHVVWNLEHCSFRF